MDWLEESRRSAFERGERIRAGERGVAESTQDLSLQLPEDLRLRAVKFGNELILPYEDALSAIRIATEGEIAVLGFDSGEVIEGGFQSLDYSGYDCQIPFTGDWEKYVRAMNLEAEHWIKEHRLGKNQGYILTSTSENEFARLQR